MMSGSFKTVFAGEQVYAYRRIGSSEDALVILNAGQVERVVKLALDTESTVYLDPLDGSTVPVYMGDEGPTVTVTLPAISGRVLVSQIADK